MGEGNDNQDLFACTSAYSGLFDCLCEFKSDNNKMISEPEFAHNPRPRPHPLKSSNGNWHFKLQFHIHNGHCGQNMAGFIN